MMTRKGETETEIDWSPLQVDTAHFGMTLIRLDELRTIPMPWFVDVPSASGSWRDDDRIDWDIYFWHKWKEHGKTLYVAPDVRIGHLEVMVSELDEQLKFRQRHIADWMNDRDK